MPKRLTQEELLARAMSEAELQRLIIGTEKKPGLAWITGWTAFHIRDSRKQQVKGLPDLELLRPPRAERWELKTETGRLSAAQERVIALLRACGQVVRVVRPSDWMSGRVAEWLR